MTTDRDTDPGQPGLWYGRRRWIPFMVAAGAICVISGVTAHHAAARLFEFALVVAAIANVYRYWNDPMPPGYAEHLAQAANEPRFGTKRWHKFAIAVVALFVIWIAVAVVAALLSR